MIKVNLGTTDGGSWRLAAASAYRGLRPATETTLLGAKYRLRREAPAVADRATTRSLACGRRCISTWCQRRPDIVVMAETMVPTATSLQLTPLKTRLAHPR
jgi:hypothetical protein